MGGFSAVLGNPPFLGGSKISRLHNQNFLNYLYGNFEHAKGQTDFCIYFLRTGWASLTQNGMIGLVLVNTCSEGDSRVAGLAYIVNKQSTIVNAKRNIPWGSDATVTVSLVSLIRSRYFKSSKILDDSETENISSFLRNDSIEKLPNAIPGNSENYFEGFKPLGKGFIFSDTDDEATTHLSQMEEIIKANPSSQLHIKPFISGKEINSSWNHEPTRYIIDFDDNPIDYVRQFPLLFSILESKVKPNRLKVKRESRKKFWWKYGENNPSLRKKLTQMEFVFVNTRHSKFHSIVRMSTKSIFSEGLCIHTKSTFSDFSELQSSLHENWARYFSSTLGQGLRYSGKNAAYTYPFLQMHNQDLELIGKEYYHTRSKILERLKIGLTDFYNMIHDKDCLDEEISEFRNLIKKLDFEVIKAYDLDQMGLKYGFYSRNIGPYWGFSEESILLLINRLIAKSDEFLNKME